MVRTRIRNTHPICHVYLLYFFLLCILKMFLFNLIYFFLKKKDKEIYMNLFKEILNLKKENESEANNLLDSIKEIKFIPNLLLIDEKKNDILRKIL